MKSFETVINDRFVFRIRDWLRSKRIWFAEWAYTQTHTETPIYTKSMNYIHGCGNHSAFLFMAIVILYRWLEISKSFDVVTMPIFIIHLYYFRSIARKLISVFLASFATRLLSSWSFLIASIAHVMWKVW